MSNPVPANWPEASDRLKEAIKKAIQILGTVPVRLVVSRGMYDAVSNMLRLHCGWGAIAYSQSGATIFALDASQSADPNTLATWRGWGYDIIKIVIDTSFLGCEAEFEA